METSDSVRIIVDEAASAAPRRGVGRINMGLLLAYRHQEVTDASD
jgi:hypothetical protein